MPIISAKNVSLVLGGNLVLKNLSFALENGEYVGLIGPNAAGKTSLLKTILGVFEPTSGTIEISPKTKIGYVPQNYALSTVVPISVAEVLGMSGICDAAILAKNLKKVGLPKNFLRQNFHLLSGGQKQRVIIARALCGEANLLIFDEPLSSVDLETKLKIYDLLTDLNQNENLTILFVSHEVDHIIGQCDRVLCLDQTLHTGCHPLEFAAGRTPCCGEAKADLPFVPIHHHHSKPQK